MDRAQLLNDNEEAMRLVLDGRQAMTWTAMPGIVNSVDLDAMTCDVQPSIQGSKEDEFGKVTYENLPLLLDVPIVFPSAGGFTITMPIDEGDEVLVVIAARCIDSWWQQGGVQKPMEARMNDLSDGFAIPGPRSQPRVISGISSTALQIRNDAGDSYVEIGADGKIKLVSTEIDVQGKIKLTGDLEITGKIDATGNITTSAGNVVATVGDVKGGVVPISLELHTHISAIPGNPTGPALP